MSHNEPSEITQRKRQVSGIFDKAATTYGQVGPRYFSHFGRRLVEIAKIQSGSKVLDVATGRGAILYPATEAVGANGHVIGIDLSERMVQETNKEISFLKMSSNIEVHQMDAEHLQFPSESFDYVLCGFAIFFFPQLNLAMSEFRRVLKPNGYICVSTFDKLFYEEWRWFHEIANNYIPPPSEANQVPESNSESQPVFDTPEGLRAIMKTAGFSDIQVFSETADFVYDTEEEFWSTLWSLTSRAILEKIEKETGTEGLQKFKLDVFNQISATKQVNGFHQLFPVHFCLATKVQV